jgi:hypothetical protein
MPVDQNVYTAIKDQKDNPPAPTPAPEPAAGAVDTPAPAPVPAPPPLTPAATFDEAAWVTEKSGGKFKSWDELQAELNKPPVVQVQQPTFHNDISRQAYEAITGDRIMDLLPVLQTKKMATDIGTMPVDQRVKTYLKVKYDLNDTQAEREYERRYVPDETGLSGIDISIEKKKAEAMLNDEAETAVKYFSQKAEEIKFPQPQQQAAPQLSEDARKVVQLGSSFAATDKISKFPFEFDATQEHGIAVKGTVSLPGERIAAIKTQIATDPTSFLAGYLSRYYTPDKQVNVDALARDIAYLDDPASWANQVAKDAFNQIFVGRLAQERNRPNGTVTGGPFNGTADETQKNSVYKALRIPDEKKNGVTAPVG